LDDVGRAGYGPLSPFARLSKYQAKVLSLGVPLRAALTHAHHLEHMYGVNHMYHTVYTVPAYRDRKPDPGPWFCFVRYLGVGIEACIGHLENQLRAVGVLKETRVLSHVMQCAAVMDVEQVGYAMLKENPCAFLTEPVEVHVEAPGAAPQVPSARAVHVSLRL
jgi:aminoglycoside N3'-acetyltransferase